MSEILCPKCERKAGLSAVEFFDYNCLVACCPKCKIISVVKSDSGWVDYAGIDDLDGVRAMLRPFAKQAHERGELSILRET